MSTKDTSEILGSYLGVNIQNRNRVQHTAELTGPIHLRIYHRVGRAPIEVDQEVGNNRFDIHCNQSRQHFQDR